MSGSAIIVSDAKIDELSYSAVCEKYSDICGKGE